MKDNLPVSVKKLRRICAICGNAQGEILHTQKFALPEQHVLPREYDVVACTKCGFVFADSSSTQNDYDYFYREYSKYEDATVSSGGGTSERDRTRLAETAQTIAGALPSPDAYILDIGCANGGLLAALQDLGYKNLTGLDPSKACVAYVSNRGIPCFEGGLFDRHSLSNDRKFDLVILSHVLEHLYDLRLAVDAVLEHVMPGGLIYVEVPDASRYKDFYVVPYYYFDCEHINHFDEHSLFNLFCQKGCFLIETIKKTILVSSNNLYPAVGLFLRKSVGELTGAHCISNSTAVRNSISEYVSMSSHGDSYAEFEDLVKNNEEVVVWGAGSYTLRLLETTALGKCLIKAFVDNDASKQGRKINGIEILPPQKLYEIACPIIVCAALNSTDIVEDIRRMGLPNRVVIA